MERSEQQLLLIETYKKSEKQRVAEYRMNMSEEKKQKRRETQKLYREKNKEKIKEYRRLYKEKNKEKIKESNRLYRENNKEKVKESERVYSQTEKGIKTHRIKNWKKRGVISEDFDELYNQYLRTSYCDICKVELTYDKQNTCTTKCLDHCHVTGEVRNILCQSCNTKRGQNKF